MTDEARKAILFVSAPQHEQLCCITCYINPKEKHDPSAKSNYHWQILKCRQLIFSYKEVLASPVLGNEVQINIVMTKVFNGTGKIQKQLKDLNLHEHYSTQLTNAIYESCLRYTILAHMAPQWNQVDNCLMQGRDFLEATGPVNSIRFNVEVKDETTYIVLWPLKARLQQLHLEDLDLPPIMTQNFLTQPTSSLAVGTLWIHVIPSLKRGRILSISRQIPQSCPYKTYKDIKRHWKNSYGYRLPESEEGMLYYTLSFHPNIPTHYTYPSICVRPQRTQFLGRVDSVAVVRAFLADLARKMPNVCGYPFSVERQCSFEQTQNGHWTGGANMTQGCGMPRDTLKNLIPVDSLFTPAGLSRLQVNTPDQEADLFATQQSNDISLATPSLMPKTQGLSQLISLATQMPRLGQAGQRSASTTQTFVTDCQIPSSCSYNVMCAVDKSQAIRNGAPSASLSLLAATPRSSETYQHSQPPHGITSTAFSGDLPRHAVQTQPAPHIISAAVTSYALPNKQGGSIPSPKVVPKIVQIQPTQSLTSSELMSNVKPNQPGNEDASPVPTLHAVTIKPPQLDAVRNKFVPVFAPLFAPMPATLPVVAARKKYAPVFGFASTGIESSKANSPLVQMGRVHVPDPESSPLIQGASMPQEAQRIKTMSQAKVTPCFNVNQHSASGSTSAKLMSQAKVTPCFNINQHSASGSTSAVNVGERKRDVVSATHSATEEPCSSVKKKARSKPQVASGLDVEQLARANGLAKVNGVTLITWLRDKGVPCTTRDNKTQLVEKVKKYLNIQ